MKRLLMCPPIHFNVDYDINPWMSEQIGKVDNHKALVQWQTLFNALKKVAQVIILPAEIHMPDLVFTANAGTIVGNSAILSRFRHPERRPEEAVFRRWFEDRGYTVEQPKHDYEGEGDHLVDSEGRHWVGWGWRTGYLAPAEVGAMIEKDINVLWLADERWYHLDTCFCPVGPDEILWYPNAFLPKSRELIRNSFKISVEVSEEEALDFCCNAVVIDKDIFMPKSPNTAHALLHLGYNVHEFDLSEFIKSGGAAKCLVLKCGEATK